jgi:hypothetical protein
MGCKGGLSLILFFPSLSLLISAYVCLCVRACVFTAFSLYYPVLLDLKRLTLDCAPDTQSSCATSRRPSTASTTVKNDLQ